jgi:hypothetical protein
MAHPKKAVENTAERVLASVGASCAASAGNLPECLKVQCQLRHVCGVYRLLPTPFNDRPVYKKGLLAQTTERSEAYIIYTAMGDWMVSGQVDAGGAKCEGWAYAHDAASTPDKICTTWKVSGSAGWEEDPSLCVSAFEDLPADLRARIGYEDGTAISKHLACDDEGVLFVPLGQPDVLNEVLRSPSEIPQMRTTPGECLHITTAEAAQQELYAWLRWLFRERLDKRRQHILTQAQVSHHLCRLFACAATQQLEQAAEHVPAAASKSKEKRKGARAKKAKEVVQSEVVEDTEGLCATEGYVRGSIDNADIAASLNVDEVESNASASTSQMTASPVTGWPAEDSDGSASTRASSEEPPEVHRGLAKKTRTLMQEMGWESQPSCALDSSEIAAWLHSHPAYRQVVREGRQRLQDQFQAWASASAAMS